MLEVVTHAWIFDKYDIWRPKSKINSWNTHFVIIYDCLQVDAYNISNYGEGKRNKEYINKI